MHTDEQIYEQFNPLFSDVADEADFPAKRPLLAHYTSIPNLERILESEEVWFSNPLVMNDLEEVRFGLLRGSELFHVSDVILNACGSPERFAKLRDAFNQCFRTFDEQHVLDTYVFCLSVHDESDTDGLLSMWRGYGSRGNGAAIVFDTNDLGVVDASPLIIARVHYASANERLSWLQDLIARFAVTLAASDVPEDKLYLAAHILFERLKLFALFSKHCGFSEEREWRVVYYPDRDKEKFLTPMLHYSIGARGVEPRLRFKVAPIAGLTTTEFSLERLINRIILGPSVSSPMARMAILRMLERLDMPSLKEKVYASSIPFRSV